jgi:type IX secretion system PorP/SprF family membrane protein
MRYFFYFMFFLLSCSVPAYAQNYAVYNSFYVNPYLYNPAEAATENASLYIMHRQQWMGIEGAPMLTGLSYNSLINNTRAGYGVRLSNYQRGVLNTTDFTASYSYGIGLSQKSFLFFGLSGGLISNTIDLAKVDDPDDPAIAAYLDNNLQPVANFGLLLRSPSGVNLGVSLPQLFAPQFNGSKSFSSTNVSPFDNIFVTAYYRRMVEGKIVNRRKGGMRSRVKTKESVAPLEFYLNYKYSATGNSQFEVLGKFNLSQNFWFGASYKLPYGFTGNVGIVVDRFTLGYSYEPNSQPEAGFSKGTHDIIIGLRIGEKKRFKKAAPLLRSQIQSNTEARHTARFQEDIEDPDNITHEEVKRKTFYVVIRSFGDFNQADAYKKKLIEQKFNADVFYYEKDKKYYVHVLSTTKAGDANEEVKNLKNFTKLKDAKVLTVINTEK